MGWEYPNPSETGMRFDFSSPLRIGRVTGKYMRVEYGNGEGKTRPHPAMPNLFFIFFERAMPSYIIEIYISSLMLLDMRGTLEKNYSMC